MPQTDNNSKLSRRYELRYSHTSKFGQHYFQITAKEYDHLIHGFAFGSSLKYDVLPLHEYDNKYYIKTKGDRPDHHITSALCTFKPFVFNGKNGVSVKLTDLKVDPSLDRYKDSVIEFAWKDNIL
jgi:hypothetical protein